jgi:hypothetical protein
MSGMISGSKAQCGADDSYQRKFTVQPEYVEFLI